MENFKVWKGVVPSPVSQCMKNTRNKLIIPNKALTDQELKLYAKCLHIPFFRGVFMKDKLPKVMWENETAIVNLDNTTGDGTHWVCYKKLQNTVYYFDSFGNLSPPQELLHYFNPAENILYNTVTWQKKNTNICGHLCLDFLATSINTLKSF